LCQPIITAFAAGLPAVEAGVVKGGGWRPSLRGRYLASLPRFLR
jgi:hypothetical protein